jgi:hypothetical protein
VSLFDRVAPEAQKLLEQLDSQTPVVRLDGTTQGYYWLEFERKVEEGLLQTWVTTQVFYASIDVFLCADADNKTSLTHVKYKSRSVYDESPVYSDHKLSPATVQYVCDWVRHKLLPLEESKSRRAEQERLLAEKMRQKYLP